MKRFRVGSLLLLAILLAGCSLDYYRDSGCTISNRTASIRAEYQSFSGTRTLQAHVPEDRPMKVEVTSQSGELRLEIGQADAEPIYTGKFTEDFSFTLNAPAGEYQIRLTASQHSGSISLDWGNTNAAGAD